MRSAFWIFFAMFVFGVMVTAVHRGTGLAYASTAAVSEDNLSDEDASKRNREILQTLLENANRNFEKNVNRKPAVLGPPIVADVEDSVSAQPAEAEDAEPAGKDVR